MAWQGAVKNDADDDGPERTAVGTSPTAAPVPDAAGPRSDLDEAGRALFRLGRLFARRSLGDLLAERTPRGVERSRAVVVQTVADGPDSPGEEVSVGTVAGRLGLDPSTASRLVAAAIRGGYLASAPSAADRRRRRLELTDAGRVLAARARDHQRATFAHVTRDWADAERDAFARLFVRFVEAGAEDLSRDRADDAPGS
ncbi:MAG: hypothetical protein AVDCRST_MAG49-3587 [uncultured Thermomicrobiales bacterium]|uniref:HTH marR-type domain-containing protein n=1 Tax=uncultured Thermomicrobiales bacterium TaxID=1645740 RepID=A0A6J4V6I9_9BACT|nr:MAG: hypothetical protein AVDCRST_MAG49-3587 [uncultured Thermomicrobiales bacterium]